MCAPCCVGNSYSDDASGFGGERFGDGEADAGGRTGDEREFVFELKTPSGPVTFVPA
jgi:hypothetical protein